MQKVLTWPSYDEKDIKEDIINIVIQINGKKEVFNINKTRYFRSKNFMTKLINKDEKLWINTLMEKKSKEKFLSKIN